MFIVLFVAAFVTAPAFALKPKTLECVEKANCTKKVCIPGRQVVGVVNAKEFRGQPNLIPQKIELALNPMANLNYSVGKMRVSYAFTETSGFEEKRTLIADIESASSYQLVTRKLQGTDIFSVSLEEDRLYVQARGSRDLPLLSVWELKCSTVE